MQLATVICYDAFRVVVVINDYLSTIIKHTTLHNTTFIQSKLRILSYSAHTLNLVGCL